MDTELKIKVVLDTSEAKKELDALTTASATTGKRASGFLSQALGSGMRAVGMGVGFSAANAALQGPLLGGISDVMGEAFGGWGKALETALLANLGNEGRAQAKSREEMIAAFGTVAGIQDATPPGAHEYFSSRMGINTLRERGRSILESDPAMRSVNPERLLDKAMDNIGEMLRDAADYLVRELGKWR